MQAKAQAKERKNVCAVFELDRCLRKARFHSEKRVLALASLGKTRSFLTKVFT